MCISKCECVCVCIYKCEYVYECVHVRMNASMHYVKVLTSFGCSWMMAL